ncbi:MAG: T9SS type A sorting domain-containing protein, partial [Ferruginibacter sp.]|nr:T9SS type A sorting domain-containing protein [Ferruginibacter sp.]
HIADVVSIFPSIGTANSQLTINSIANQKIAVIITDALGKRLSNSSSTLKIGENKLPIQTNDFSSGLYLITIYFENGTKITTRFIKQ